MAHLGGMRPSTRSKDELSQSKHMVLITYTKGNINLASYGQDHADVAAKGGKLVLGPK